MNFEWDKAKARSNLRKHRVSFEEATTVFGDPLSLTILDPIHSDVGEERFIIMGKSFKGRMLAVVFVERNSAMRIISARFAMKREMAQYEESA